MELNSISSFNSSIGWLAETRTRQPVGSNGPFERYSVVDQIAKPLGIYKHGISYAACRIKVWLATFVQRGTTPFIHCSWAGRGGRNNGGVNYEWFEDVMLDAISACALYVARNEDNRGAIFQDIRRKVKSLKDVRMHWKFQSREDVLASLQALLLYHIIRLSDGDILLRTEAKTDNEVLAT
jgi:hypothetical protein